MTRKRIVLLTVSSFALVGLLAGCGETSSSGTGTSGDNSSSSSALPVDPTFDKDSGSFSFKKNPTFTGAESLPVVDHCVAFCPVSAGFTGVYCWNGNGTATAAEMFGEWPGKTMSTKAASDSTWYEVDLTGYTSSMIIFNGSGQTADLSMPSAGYYWYWPSDGLVHNSVPATSWIQYARFIDGNKIQIVANKNITSFTVKEGETTLISGEPGYNAVDVHPNQHGVDLTKTYTVTAKLEGETTELTKEIAIDRLYSTDTFNNTFAYEGSDLGVTYTAAKSSFKVWSPFSSALELRIYQNGTPLSVSSSKGDDTIYKKVAMSKGEKGVWSAEVAEDLNGKYYTYFVTNTQNPNGAEVVDPYAKAVGANGRRGEILDLSTTDPEGWSNVTVNPYDRKELTVWECHIADLTSSTTWTGTATNAKRYAGFHEAGTTYTANGSTVKTGFDHVKELGVNAVQILPMFDQDNDETLDIYDAANNKTNGAFNWGYNPLNYNAPEGIYSSNPYDGAVRIKELKALIADYTKAGINIIMDVVYNHVSSAGGSNFNILAPGYYFRLDATGAFSNGSGCGNETASDHYMMRKFMIDSASYWTKEYKLGGFRFDLMGLHDIETMNQLTAACQKVNPKIAIYGEPWTGGTTTLNSTLQAKQANLAKFVGYGAFNDKIRDSLIKGGMNSTDTVGWATSFSTTYQPSSDVDSLVGGIKGITGGTTSGVADPDKSVAYVACHDNYTLHDRIRFLTSREENILKAAKLAESVVFTSQGTSFMLSGDEFLRHKAGTGTISNGNSYNASYDVNTLDYSLKITNASMFATVQKLVALKQKVSGLHLDATGIKGLTVTVSSGSNMLTYEVKDSSANKTYKIVHAAGVGTLPTADFAGYSLYLDTLDSGVALSAATTISPFQTIIASK